MLARAAVTGAGLWFREAASVGGIGMSPRRVLAMLACVAVALGLGGFVGTASAATPPSNDLISGATVVSVVAVQCDARHDGSDNRRERRAGEPALRCSGRRTTVFGTRSRPAPATPFSRSTRPGSTFSSGVLIATGTPGALTTQACGPITSKVAVASGTTYFIMAFDDTGSGGTLHISMHGAGPVPANDTIGHSAVVSRLPYHATLDTTGATTDAVDTSGERKLRCTGNGQQRLVQVHGRTERPQHLRRRLAERLRRGCAHRHGHTGCVEDAGLRSGFFVTAATRPGTTYHIMIFDAFGSGGGTLRLNIGDAPNLALSVHTSARHRRARSRASHGHVPVHRSEEPPHLGIAHRDRGEQGADRPLRHARHSRAPSATASAHSWTGLVLPPNKHAFAPGKAAVFTNGSRAATSCARWSARPPS